LFDYYYNTRWGFNQNCNYLLYKSGRGVKLTTHLQLVPRSRKCGSIHQLPHTSSWRSASSGKARDKFTFTKFRTIKFPALIRMLFGPTCYRIMLPVRRMTSSSSNSKHKLAIINRHLYTVHHFSYPHQNIVITHKIGTIYWDKRLLSLSVTTAC
jgi:hypothetical protein